MSVRYLSCGDTAFTVEFGNEISPAINSQVMALHAVIGEAKLKKLSARLAASGITIDKFQLSSLVTLCALR